MSTADTEIIFVVEQEEDGGYVASAAGQGIFTQGDTLEDLRRMVRDAVACAYEGRDDRPQLIRLHFVHDEVIAV